ncbi:MAG: tryptophan synthase subunit alpha [Bacteroidota bacterium]
MTNRIQGLFRQKPQNILSIFLTSGYPKLEDTRSTIIDLAKAGVDMIEIGMPFSDPIADGSTIQHSNQVALNNGITVAKIFEQLENIRSEVDIPLLLMGYLNPVMQYGMEAFCVRAAQIGIDGLILPDLPMMEYRNMYQELFQKHNLSNIFLVTPQTSEKRIQMIDKVSDSFIYVVSTDSTTGKTEGFGPQHLAYFERIQEMNLQNPTLVGFGISNHQTYSTVCQYSSGAIIGSAFIKALGRGETPEAFVHGIRSQSV